MPGTAVRIGPFKGGLNTSSDPSAIADDELAVCENFEFDTDGALTSRPPIEPYIGSFRVETVKLLGYFTDNNGASWLLSSFFGDVYYDNSGEWVSTAAAIEASAMVQYGSKAWVIAQPGSIGDGGWWTPPTTPGDPGTWTNVAAMPKGMAGTIFKDRLYIVAGSMASTNASRVWFSNNGDPATWTSSDFVDVSPGDGQKLIDLYTSGNALYLFKEDSTYVFSYDSAPTKGVLQPISPIVGVSGTECIIQHENTIYVYHEGFIYELVNYIYSKLNYKINLEASTGGSTAYLYPVSLCIVGDRLICRYFDNVYVFNLRTRTWTTWTSGYLFANFIKIPKLSTSKDPNSYIAAACDVDDNMTYKLIDAFGVQSEVMICKIRTKIFDFNSPNLFKRLYWWGVDLIAQGDVTGTVTPVVYTFSVTWGQLNGRTWSSLSSSTWGQPLNTAPTVVDTVSTTGSVGRRFLKFLKAIRFRNVYFDIEMTTDGTSTQAPIKIFTVNPVINQKQQVGKDVN